MGKLRLYEAYSRAFGETVPTAPARSIGIKIVLAQRFFHRSHVPRFAFVSLTLRL